MMISTSERRLSTQSIRLTALMLGFIFFPSFGRVDAQQHNIRQLFLKILAPFWLSRRTTPERGPLVPQPSPAPFSIRAGPRSPMRT